MKRKSILLVLCIGMILTSCESKISLNSTDVKNEKNQKNTTMENPDKGYNLPIDIVNIGLHFILKNVRPYAAPCSEA